MKDLMQKIIDFLIEKADPSIVLRVKKEVTGNLSNEEENDLLDRITRQKIVQIILQSQKPDGWFGNSFHGQSPKFGAGMYDNMEVGLRYLAEKGFPPENEIIAKAVNSFLLKEPFDTAYRVKPPQPPDTDCTYTAIELYLTRSSLIIRAGYEFSFPPNDFIDIKHDIDFSFKTFTSVLNYDTLDDVIYTRRNKLCFKPGVLWPCSYNLRILAHSQGWRSEQNTALLADSMDRLFSFPHTDEMVYTYRKGQFVGPCFPFIHSHGKIIGIMDKENISLDMMELFARCGIVRRVPMLADMYESLLARVDDDLDVNISLDKRKDHGWSPYFGFALEEDWKDKTRMQCDVLFRILLIMHYAEKLSG
ncbi:MAG: hypothetical protein GX940_09865 [Clostridiaceae bacterium]|nr:hypothetical protein [Clostridiaceae bacterium]